MFRKPVLSVVFRAMPRWFHLYLQLAIGLWKKAKFFLYSIWSRRCSVISFIGIKAVFIKKIE